MYGAKGYNRYYRVVMTGRKAFVLGRSVTVR